MNNIESAAMRIMAAENVILQNMRKNQKLVVLLGEIHTQHSHSLIVKKVIAEQLKAYNKNPELSFCVGLELSLGIKTKKTGVFEEQTPQHYLNTSSLDNKNKDIIKYCLKKNISIQFNDAVKLSTNRGDFIDNSHPLNHQIIKKHNPSFLKKNISPFSTEGIAIRNIAIAENAVRQIKNTSANIHIQHCGMAHVLGVHSGIMCNYPYKDSLCAKFLERGFAVLPVFLDRKFYENFIRFEPAGDVAKILTIDSLSNIKETCQKSPMLDLN